ncbi:hypothetical protein [Polyangium aurulentum]|uniref:hypothetical protein n=1 Tax=Polyangium aurulentum TaxID=2567896 RepID=UPI0010AE9111|nr:hypothetical protein [Polyangium aurulentum]UQA60410.1 hypothetical protein E8A73_008025 [Polyangium aurulentum]
MIIGATAAPFLTFDVNDQGRPYVGVSLLPEFRYAYSLDPDMDTPRVFASVRWTAFSTSVPFEKNVPAERASNVELMGAMGFSFALLRSKETVERMTTSVAWFSLGAGFGNVRAKGDTMVSGPLLFLSLDTDALSFNIGGSAR